MGNTNFISDKNATYATTTHSSAIFYKKRPTSTHSFTLHRHTHIHIIILLPDGWFFMPCLFPSALDVRLHYITPAFIDSPKHTLPQQQNPCKNFFLSFFCPNWFFSCSSHSPGFRVLRITFCIKPVKNSRNVRFPVYFSTRIPVNSQVACAEYFSFSFSLPLPSKELSGLEHFFANYTHTTLTAPTYSLSGSKRKKCLQLFSSLSNSVLGTWSTCLWNRHTNKVNISQWWWWQK